ncbi:MAG: toxin-antitoxin system HicB family antitoxin, partial [Methylomonas sp.]|nr:toxin-antitoxin system HicB family antitoxin [Methylomonas sp.]
TYEANTIDELKREFEKAVDDYLTTCHEHGITPKNTCKGSFNVRIGSDLHQRLLAKADAAGTSLNDYLKGIIEKDTMTI